jgi:Radical SAM superfamily
LQRQHGVEHFHLTDNALPVPVLKALATPAAEGPGYSWHGFVRFEPALLDEALVAGLAGGGCRLLQLGLESGSQSLLDRIGKGTRLEQVSRILANLQRAGIASYVYVMLGVPGETESDAERTLEFLERHAESIGFLNLAIMNLPRESELLASPQAAGIATLLPLSEDEPLGLYRGFTPVSGWGRSEARRFLQQRLLASPAIRAIAQRTPPLFTSNHAFLFGSKAVEKL